MVALFISVLALITVVGSYGAYRIGLDRVLRWVIKLEFASVAFLALTIVMALVMSIGLRLTRFYLLEWVAMGLLGLSVGRITFYVFGTGKSRGRTDWVSFGTGILANVFGLVCIVFLLRGLGLV